MFHVDSPWVLTGDYLKHIGQIRQAIDLSASGAAGKAVGSALFQTLRIPGRGAYRDTVVCSKEWPSDPRERDIEVEPLNHQSSTG